MGNITNAFEELIGCIIFPVYEGERPRLSDNLLLGKLVLSGIPLAPRGVPQIKVCDIDANGILTVSTKEKATGTMVGIFISNVKGTLSKDEIDIMLEDAERFKLKGEELKTKFAGKVCFYSNRTTITTEEVATKLPAVDAKKIEDEIKYPIQWLDEHQLAEAEVFEKRRKELESIWNSIITKMQ